MTIPARPKRQIARPSIRSSSRRKVRCSASTGAGRSSGGHSTLVSHVASAKHTEFTNRDETFAKVKGWVNEMIAGLEERTSTDSSQHAYCDSQFRPKKQGRKQSDTRSELPQSEQKLRSLLSSKERWGSGTLPWPIS